MTSAALNAPVPAVTRTAGVQRWIVIFAWCAIVLGIVLRLTQLPTRTLYNDESFTLVRVAGHTAAEMIRDVYAGRPTSPAVFRQYTTVDSSASVQRLTSSLISEDAQHPPLFYVAELGLVKALGNSLIAWRLLPALFGILGIAAAFALARELFRDVNAGLLAAGLFAVSPIERIYSDQAREYSLFALLTLLATLAVVRASRSNNLGAWAIYALLATAGLYADPIMAYVIAAHAVFVAGSNRTALATKLPPFAGACVAALVAYLPWIYEMIAHRADIAHTNGWSGERWPLARLAAKWAFNTGSTFFDLEYLDLRWGIVFAVVAVVAAIVVVRGFRAADAEARWCLGAAILVPAILLAAPDVLLGQHRSAVARYGIPVFAMLAIVAARGLVGRPLATIIIVGAGLWSSALGSLHPTWWDNDTNADDARISAIVNGVPRAQVVTTILPPFFVGFARSLDDDVRVSSAPSLAEVQFSPQDPLFVLRPSAADLRALVQRTGLTFSPVGYARTTTAHDLGTHIGKIGEASQMADLYRAVDESPNHHQ